MTEKCALFNFTGDE